MRAEALAKGEPEPKGEPFDSNYRITPGTPFMARLSEHLRFYVQKKQTGRIRCGRRPPSSSPATRSGARASTRSWSTSAGRGANPGGTRTRPTACTASTPTSSC